jgi:hypothetical protein
MSWKKGYMVLWLVVNKYGERKFERNFVLSKNARASSYRSQDS